MRKNLIAVAAALATTPLFAQTTPEPSVHTSIKGSDLAIYGVADVFAIGYNTTSESKFQIGSGGSQGSRLGFLASREANSDLKVGMRLEAGYNVDTGRPSSTSGVADRVWTRQAYLSLANKKYGEIRAGRVQGPTYDFVSLYDPMLMPTADSWGVLTTLGQPVPAVPTGTGQSSGFNINPTIRTDNTIEYVSPNVDGFVTKLAYSFDERVGTAGPTADMFFNYENGPFSIGLDILQVGARSGSGATLAAAETVETALGASYDFGSFKLYTTQISKSNTDPTLLNGSARNSNHEGVGLYGAIVPTSAKGNLRFTYGKYDSGVAEKGATSAAVAYTYDVDAGLMFYGAYSVLTQEKLGQWQLFQSAKPDAGAKVEAIVVGAAWRF